MTRQWIAGWVSGVALAAGLAMPALAEDRRAVVVAGSVADRAGAVAMSETLLGLGFDVARLESPDDDKLAAALAALSKARGPTVVYLGGAPDALGDAIDESLAGPRFVFVDACDLTLPSLPGNVLAVTATDCDATFTQTVLSQLTVPGLPTDQWNLGEGYDVVSTLTTPFVFRTPTSDVRLSADDYAMLDTLSPAARDQMIALWRKAGIAVDAAPSGSAPAPVQRDPVRVAAVQPVAPAAVVRPVAPRVTGGVSPVQERVAVISRPSAAPVTAPQTGQTGLPQPSILVGYVVEALPDAPLVPNEPLAGNAFGSDDVTARETLRDQDAAAFGGLVEAGAFDPPEDQVARALQVELARINCYTSGIDGAWGPGSQRALLAFYEEIGVVPPGSDPDLDAFRAVIVRDDIRCPDPVPVAQPVAAARPVPAPAPAAPQSTRVAPAPAAQPAPAPAPAAPSQPARRSISQTGGTGVFR